jgi:hypothetical protein
MHGRVIAASAAAKLAGWLQVINYDTDLPAHYTLSATFNFHDVKLNDQEQAAIRIIWNECVAAGWPRDVSPGQTLPCCIEVLLGGSAGCACGTSSSTNVSGSCRLLQGVPWPHTGGRHPDHQGHRRWVPEPHSHVVHDPGVAYTTLDSVQCRS